MKILAFSDLHHSRHHAEALVKAGREADLVIGAGDFCNARQKLPEAMTLLGDMSAPMIVVPGNSESIEELRDAAHVNTTVLHGNATEIDGVHFFGLGYAVPQTPFGTWSCDLAENEADELLNRCNHVDIVILHSPPKGVADVTSRGQSVGSTAIRAAIERLQPKLALCGHVHDSWGRSGLIGQTRVVNLGPSASWFDI